MADNFIDVERLGSKKPGDVIQSADWNALVIGASQIELNKLNRNADSMVGPLTVQTDVEVRGQLKIPSANPTDTRIDLHGALRFNGVNNRRIYGAVRGGHSTVVVNANWDDLEIKGRVIDWTGSDLWLGYETNHTAHSIFLGRDERLGRVQVAQNADFHVRGKSTDPNGTTVVIGQTNSSNLRLGFHDDYTWIQSHGGKPLTINPVGNRVGIGLTDPQWRTFHVHGNGSEIHASGTAAGFSFMDRAGEKWDSGQPGERWVLYSTSKVARLWTSGNGDRLTIDTDGNLAISGKIRNTTLRGARPAWLDRADSRGLLVSSGSDNAYFGMKSRGAGDNDYDTVIYWGDDREDDLVFETEDLGQVARFDGHGRLALGVDRAHGAARLHVGGHIMMQVTANNANAGTWLRDLPDSTLIFGGVWQSGLYFYWRFGGQIHGLRISAGSTGNTNV